MTLTEAFSRIGDILSFPILLFDFFIVFFFFFSIGVNWKNV